jgi:2',3'-cyclic-nucleotide 2'-phosphodiesterase (5'-nucleotidase family)
MCCFSRQYKGFLSFSGNPGREKAVAGRVGAGGCRLLSAAARKNLSIANTTFTIRNNKPENILIGGRPFNPQQTYTIAISDYLANGGDDMSFLKEALRSEKAGILLREAIIKQIRQVTAQNKPVEAAIGGRR